MDIANITFIDTTTFKALESPILPMIKDDPSNPYITSDSSVPISLIASSDYVTNSLSDSKDLSCNSDSVENDELADTQTSPCTRERQQPTAQGGKALAIGRGLVPEFLPLDKVIHELTHADETLVPEYVPRGTKENVYFLVQNGHNVERRKKGQIAQFWDDCGAWGPGGPTNIYYYLCQPGLRTFGIVKKNNVYGLLKYRNKKITFKPMDPQPSDCDVLKVRRRYCRHSLSSDYMRRITYIEVEDDSKKLACYEYKGKFPGRAPHGKTTNALAADYIRTKVKVLDEMKEQLKTQKPRTVYRNADIIDGPQTEKQVRDLQYRLKRKNHPKSTGLGTLAEQMVLLVEHQAESSFVQLLLQRPGKKPCAILYKPAQVSDVRRFCCSAPSAQTSILGVDKTLSLGDIHVTTTVFKYLAVCRETGEYPMMPGPIFLHGNCDQETYFLFFQHLAGVLYDAPSTPTLGSDEEKAIRLAFTQAFPGAAMMCCTKNLKKNVLDYLKDNVGMSHKARQSIMQIFSNKGVLGSQDMATLDFEIESAMDLINNSALGFKAYFSNCIAPILRENMKACMNLTTITMEWTNNNRECYKHVLKQLEEWKSLKLTDLVGKLESEIDASYNDIKRAFLYMGNFILDKQYAEFSVDRYVWCSMSTEEQERHFDKFLNKIKEVDSRNSTTQYGNIISVTPTHTGKRPNQQKREHQERTTSTNNRKRKRH